MDLSQFSGYIRMDSFDSAIVAITGFMVIILAMLLFSSAFSPSKSGKYRSLLTDMYVVGMVKKFAEQDNIDLNKELKIFAKIQKQKKISEKALDQVIEDELKEKIAKVTEENLDTAVKETSKTK